jgi:hypothetical protein
VGLVGDIDHSGHRTSPFIPALLRFELHGIKAAVVNPDALDPVIMKVPPDKMPEATYGTQVRPTVD